MASSDWGYEKSLRRISLAAVLQVDVLEALHADDGEEVVDEQQHDDGRRQPRDQDHGRPENVPETLLHPEQGQQPKTGTIYCNGISTLV